MKLFQKFISKMSVSVEFYSFLLLYGVNLTDFMVNFII